MDDKEQCPDPVGQTGTNERETAAAGLAMHVYVKNTGFQAWAWI